MAAGEILLGSVLAHGPGVVLRATVLLLGAFALVFLLRRSSARARHALWTVVLAGLLVLPAVMLMAPAVPVPLPGIGAAEGAVVPVAQVQGGEGTAIPSPPAASEVTGSMDPVPSRTSDAGVSPPVGGDVGLQVPMGPGPEGDGARDVGAEAVRGLAISTLGALRDGAPATLAALWLVGFTALLGCLLTGVVRARALLRAAAPVSSPEWGEALARGLAAAGKGRKLPTDVSIRLSPDVRTPLAGGGLRSVIVLPEGAREWSAERRELVLVHELIHLRRKDPLRLLVGRLALAVHWFHPLAWIAVRAATLAREEACDEEVVALGHRPSTYAGHLLALAEPDPLPTPAFSRIDRPPLEKRILSILRSPARRRPFVPVGAAVLGGAWAFMAAASTPAGGMAPGELPPTPALSAADTLPAPPPPSSPPEAPPGTFSPETSEPPPGPGPGLAAEGARAPDPDRTVDRSLRELRVPAAADPGDACRARAGGLDFEDGQDFEGARGGEPGILAVWSRGDRFVQRSLEGFMLCIRIRGEVAFEEDGRIRSLPEGAWVVLAVRDGLEGGEVLQRLEIVGGSPERVHSWYVAGEQHTFDDQARHWRDAMLGVFGRQMAGAALRGEAAGIRGEIAQARGEEARLRGAIARIQGELASLRGELAPGRGEETALRGEFAGMWGAEARIRDERAQLRGEVDQARAGLAGLRHRLSALESAQALTVDPETRARLTEEAEELRSRLRDQEDQLLTLQGEVEERLAALDRELDAHQDEAERRAAELEARREALDEAGERAVLQDRLDALDLDRRLRTIQAGIEAEEARLLELIRGIR